jgi:hypothetical protein
LREDGGVGPVTCKLRHGLSDSTIPSDRGS